MTKQQAQKLGENVGKATLALGIILCIPPVIKFYCWILVSLYQY